MQLDFYNGRKSGNFETALKIVNFSYDGERVHFEVDEECLATNILQTALFKVEENHAIDAFAADNVAYAIDFIEDMETEEYTPYFVVSIGDAITEYIPVALSEKEMTILFDSQFVRPDLTEEVKEEIRGIPEMIVCNTYDEMIKKAASMLNTLYRSVCAKNNKVLSGLPGFTQYINQHMYTVVSGWLNDMYVEFAKALKATEAAE